MATAAINNLPTQATYVDALTIGPDDFDYINYFVYNAACVAQAFDVGPGGDWQTGNWGPEQLLAPSSGLITKTGGVRFRTSPATPGTVAQIIAYGFKAGNSQWMGGQPLTQTISPSGTVTNGGTMITGQVSSAGAVTAGTGFTVSRTSAGRYTVTFSTAFAAAPTVVLTLSAGADLIANTSTVTAASFLVVIDTPAGTPTDQAFHFLAATTV